MDKNFVAGPADARRRAGAYGQITDGFHPAGARRGAYAYGQITDGFNFAYGSESANAYGQTIDAFDVEQFLSPPDEQTLDHNNMLPQNGEHSNAVLQPEASVPQATPVEKSKGAISSKRRRERKKKQETEMVVTMAAHTQENKILKDENGALKGENTRMNQALQSLGKQIDQLQRDHNELKHEHKKQNGLVQTLSETLLMTTSSDRGHTEEIQKLQYENHLLRQGMVAVNLDSQLIEENSDLKHKLRLKDVQLSALNERLIVLEDQLREKSIISENLSS